MRLLQQIITKVYSLHEENMIRMNYKRAIWQFYTCYNVSLAILNRSDSELIKKNRLFKRIMTSPQEVSSKNFKKIQQHMKKDTYIIFDALQFIQDSKDNKVDYIGGYAEDPARIGILAFEFIE